ncbi:MAG: sulfite exporter TauE/SafE family protein [Candidatus Micrarchaeaceae archaeon]
MIAVIYFILLALVGLAAGVVGSLTGLGGGVVLIPMLTLAVGIPIEYAAGASLISTIATSSGAASAYVKDKLANIKIGMSLEIATTLGAITGALIAAAIYALELSKLIFIIFGVVLLFSLYPLLNELRVRKIKVNNHDWTTDFFQLQGSYYDNAGGRTVKYSGYRWWLGESVMAVAGVISGLLGIGSGALKVIGMDWGMKLPIKVTTSTSNFMIGVTAAASSAIYWVLGYITPIMVAPIVIGVLVGSYIGSKTLPAMRGRSVRILFIIILAILSIEMMLRGIGIA